MVIGGKRMIVETRIYEAPTVARVATALNAPAESKLFIKPTRGNLIQGFHSGHYAYDIADRTQPPVWAAGPGKVVKVVNNCDRVSYGCGGGYGNHVIIDHGDGLQTLYAHLEKAYVNVDDQVTQGMVIGPMGRSGNVRGATGMHLHFEVRLNGKKQVPGDYY
jgi:murein DD-endopeptidase MepM/ murein hydrolase activator NlpD